MERLMRCVFKRVLSGNWLRFTVVEIALRVDVQPPSRLIVFVALDLAGFAFPLITFRFFGQSRFYGRVVS
jgi:hypothetical protein